MTKRNVFLQTIVFIVFMLFAFLSYAFLATSILLKIELFTHVDGIIWIVAGLFGLALSLLVAFLITHRFKKEFSLVWFIKDHFQGFITSYLFLLLFVNSIQKEIEIGADAARDFLAIQWAIFAITVGAFAIWHALIFNKVYFNEKKPTQLEDNGSLPIKELNNIISLSEKRVSYQEYIRKIDPLVFVLVNLIAIILATGAVFLFKDYKVWNESFVYFSFYCCTNTLLNVVFDIAVDLFVRRNELLKSTKVKASDYNEAVDSVKAAILIEMFSKHEALPSLSNNQVGEGELKDCFERLNFIIEEYKKDKNTFEEHKKEFVILIDKIGTLRKKYSKVPKQKKKKTTKPNHETEK